LEESASEQFRQGLARRQEDDRRMPAVAAIISPEHPDAVAYRRAADAFRAGDLDTLATTIHEDVIWHLPGTSWMARDFEGRASLLEFLRELMVRTNGTFKLRDVYVSGSDDHVLAFQRLGATVDGVEQFFDVSSVMRFSDGRQKERWFHIHDLNAFDDFFARF
jgi:ketosteroid isomerase-like protein